MDMKQTIIIIQELSVERGVPNNVRGSLNETIEILQNSKSEQEGVSSAISILDESSNDPNVAPHIRTQMWNILSSLEGMRKS